MHFSFLTHHDAMRLSSPH